MGNPNDDALAQLERDWPGWQCWVVIRYIGPPTWCARRRDDHKVVINSDSAEHLAEALEDEVSEPADLDRGWVSGTSGTEEIPLMDVPMTGALLAEMYPAWTIERNPLGVWTAELISGSEVRYLVAAEAWQLGLKIKAAEQAEQ
jgi:hypothetical protein